MKYVNRAIAILGSILVLGVQIIFEKYSWNENLACMFFGMQIMAFINMVAYLLENRRSK